MAPKKKSKKKSVGSKKPARGKATPAKKRTEKRKLPKKSSKSRSASNKAAATKKVAKRAAGSKSASVSKKGTRNKARGRSASSFSPEMLGPGSAGQSGDLQGLSDVESADSESVDELIEEGNAFEAGVVSGVEDAGRRGDREVRTREVLEDDVPGEYLDKDQ